MSPDTLHLRHPLVVAAFVACALAAALVGGRAYASSHAGHPGAVVRSVSCTWAGGRLHAAGTIRNPGGRGTFGVAVRYSVAGHGMQPALSAAVRADAHASASFAWSERGRFPGAAITSCTATAPRESSGD